MKGTTPPSNLCHQCGTMLAPFSDLCQTCSLLDSWKLAVETSNLTHLIKKIKPEQLVLVVRYIQRLRENLDLSHKKKSRRRTSQQFDFALQEIEKTARGLELTSIEAIGVLEMVKQSFIEEMYYDDYDSRTGEGFDDTDEPEKS